MYRQTIPNIIQLFSIFILWLMCLPLLSLSIALVKFNLVLPQNAANEGWWLLRRDLRQGLFESRRGMGRAEPHPCGRSCRSDGCSSGRAQTRNFPRLFGFTSGWFFCLFFVLSAFFCSVFHFSFRFVSFSNVQIGDLSSVINEKGCVQAGEEWLEKNLLVVAGVAVGIAFLQVQLLATAHSF